MHWRHGRNLADSTLFLIGRNGSFVRKRFLGYGSIPETVFANEVTVFLVLPGDGGRSVLFDYANYRSLGSYGFTDGNKEIPMIRSENKADFTLTLAGMTKIPDSMIPAGSFKVTEKAKIEKIGIIQLI